MYVQIYIYDSGNGSNYDCSDISEEYSKHEIFLIILADLNYIRLILKWLTIDINFVPWDCLPLEKVIMAVLALDTV